MATIDGTIVHVALPAIERDLGGGLPAQQWVSNAYLLALASLIPIGGSLGDIYGERRVFAIGLAALGAFSIACALAPTIELLIAARALQGAAGALVTPSSLAIIVAAFSGRQRGAAIGSWTAWGGIAAIVGPLAGGWIVDQASWRWIFALNVLLVVGKLLLVFAAVPQTAGARARPSPRHLPAASRGLHGARERAHDHPGDRGDVRALAPLGRAGRPLRPAALHGRRAARGGRRILLLLRTGLETSYLRDLVPALLVFALGLSMTVAPLTATVLADADESDAGIASAINNSIARVAGLVGVSAIGVVVAGSLVGEKFAANPESARAFHRAVAVCAALVAAGGVVGAIGVVNPRRRVEAAGCAGGQLVGTPRPAVDRA